MSVVSLSPQSAGLHVPHAQGAVRHGPGRPALQVPEHGQRQGKSRGGHTVFWHRGRYGTLTPFGW